MTFTARYRGTCNSDNCRYDTRIREGDDVDYYNGELMHRECANAASRDADTPRCTTCFTYHRGEC